MQLFYDPANNNASYAFEADVVVTGTPGSYVFTTALGAVLGPYPATLVEGPAPALPAATLLANAQASQSSMLSQACAATIVGGFTSSALGSEHMYPSKQTDQINLMGSVTDSLYPGLAGNWTTIFWCADSTGTWAYTPHSAAQIQQVGSDGKAWVTTQQTKLAMLNYQIAQATTVDAVEAVTW